MVMIFWPLNLRHPRQNGTGSARQVQCRFARKLSSTETTPWTMNEMIALRCQSPVSST